MITKRVIVIIKNVFTLIGLGFKYLAMRILDYQKHLKTTLDYLDKPRYISADYDEQDNMEYYDTPKSEVKISKWDKKSAPYCETP
jgi:hypothetical protein